MKKYSVNVHYDAIVEVEVLADSEEEAIRLAEDMAADMPQERMWIPNGPENSCVTSSEDIPMPLDEAIKKANDLIRTEGTTSFSDVYITETRVVPYTGEVESTTNKVDTATWSDDYDEIELFDDFGDFSIPLSNLPQAEQYEVCTKIIEKYEE